MEAKTTRATSMTRGTTTSFGEGGNTLILPPLRRDPERRVGWRPGQACRARVAGWRRAPGPGAGAPRRGVCPQALTHLARRQVPGGVDERHCGTDGLAPLQVWEAEDHHVEDVVEVPGHGVLDDAGVDLEAAGVDDVVGPAVDDEQAFVVEVAEIVGAEPPDAIGVDGESVAGQSRLAEVAVLDGVAA